MSWSNLKDGSVRQEEGRRRLRRLCIPRIYARVRIGFGLGRSSNNEFDWIMSGENTYPMIPGDVIKCTIPRCVMVYI